jgi:predicted RND superfamily exporter protein
MNRTEPGKRTRAFVAWTLRHGRMLWVIAVLLTIPAAFRTANLYMHLRSELDELLPREAASVTAIQELRRRMPGLQYLGVLVDVGDKSRLPAGERLLDDLAARVRTYPPDLVRTVRTGVTEERAFLREHAALFMDLADLRAVRERIEARRDYEVQKSLDLALEDGPPPSIDFSDIEDKYRQRDPTRDRFPDGRFSSAEIGATLLLIEVGGFSTGADRGRQLMERVKADLAELGGPERYAPGMRIGFTGDVAISVEEMSGLIADLSLSSVLVLVTVVAVIFGYFQWWRSVAVLGLPLMVAACYAFALVSLPPFRITELNSNTAFMGSIIVGNGVNTGIILLARYMEERRAGVIVEEALARAIWGTRTATLSASLAAGVAYVSLVVTQFRGFQQFGAIGGIGMVLCWGAAYLLMPPLAAWLDGGRVPPVRAQGRLMAPLSWSVARYPAAISTFALLVTFVAVFSLRGFDLSQLEHDFSRLRRASTWTSGEGFWGRKMDGLLGRYLSPTVILSDSAVEAHEISAELRRKTREGALAERVASVRTIDDVLPSDQGEKLAELVAIKKMLTPNLLSFVPEERRADIDRLIGEGALRPLAPADLPASLTTGLREKDGAFDRVVLVYPRPSKVLWQGPPLMAYVDELRSIAARNGSAADLRPARVAGSHPLTADIIRAVERDGPIAMLTAFVGVVVVVVAMFRGRATTLFVLGSLLTGVVWFAAATLALGVRVNFTNFIALPITLGIGVDYAVNVMGRYEEDGQKDITAAIRATGGAVGLCSLTTIIGYSSLLVADNRALFSFGVVAVLGEIACLVSAVVVLPAVLVLWSGRRQKAAPAPGAAEPAPGATEPAPGDRP